MNQILTKYIIKRLEAEGWVLKGKRGSHWTYGKSGNPSIITVVITSKTQSIGVARTIARNVGWDWPLT